MKQILWLLAGCFLLMAQASADTEADEEFAPVPAPPEIPDPLQNGQPIEPEVTIIHREKAVVEEYRLNGRLYMVKVTPSVGKPYYLVDKDGNGTLESRMSDIYNNNMVPQWVLFSW